MREKPVQEKTIGKYLDFLYSVRENALPYKCIVSLSEIVGNFGINKSAPKALVKLNIIKKINTTSWEWVDLDVWPDKELALKVLDFLLHSNKKTTHVPILPDFATDIAAITGTLNQIRDNVAETNVVLNRIKTNRSARQREVPANFGEQVHGETLFTEADKRFELMRSITSGIYNNAFLHSKSREFLRDKKYQVINEIIIASVDDLMKLLSPEEEKLVQQGTGIIGYCVICRKPIREDKPYSKSADSDNLYCQAHSGDAKLIKGK